MTIEVLKPGLQTTVQATPRLGFRHLGVPASGAADPLSMALANRLVGNNLLAPSLESTLTGVSLRFLRDVQIAIAGADCQCQVNGNIVARHSTIDLQTGDTLIVGAAEKGVRSYIAVAGGLRGDEFLGSVSTYLPAGLGGCSGRSLEKGDVLHFVHDLPRVDSLETPGEFRPPMLDAWTLRAGRSIETHLLSDPDGVFDKRFEIGNRNDRMGIKLDGVRFDVRSAGRMPSAPVFPGIVQCPENGEPFLLSVDAQTTGGYARIAKVTRADLHQLGQLRTGDRLTLIERGDADAVQELRNKHAYFKAWLPEISEVI